MSHEIRTPLNAILGYSQILLRDVALHPFHRDALATISSSSDHLLRIINEILDLSKIDAGRMELETSDFDLVGLIHELTALFQHPCEEKQLGLRVKGWMACAACRARDAGKLRQVLINLVGNAVKFTQSGRVVVRLGRREDAWTFEVSDTGIGIPPKPAGHLRALPAGAGFARTWRHRWVDHRAPPVELMGASSNSVPSPAPGPISFSP